MTGFLARRGLALALGLAFVAWIASAGSAAAQTAIGEPIELIPPGTIPSVTAEPIVLEPAAGFGNTIPPDPAVEGVDAELLTLDPWSTLPAESGEEIVIDNLPQLEISGAGLLTEQSGGLPSNLWQGADRAVVELLLGRLPGEARSPAMRDLARRVLLTAGAVPMGGSDNGDFLDARAEALVSLGNLGDAAALMRTAPGREGNAALTRIDVEMAFLADDSASACALVRASIAQSTEAFWQRALIYCQILDGQTEAAVLGLDLLEELGDDDPAFAVLATRLASGPDQSEVAVRSPTALHLAMMRSAGLPVDESQIRNMSAAVLAAAAETSAMPIEVRLLAVERAHAFGMLTTDRLIRVYEAVPFTPEELAAPLSVAETMDGALARALLYQTAIAQPVAIARAEVLQRAWQLSLVDGHYLRAVHAMAALARNLTPAPELGWFAADAVRAMIAAGDEQAAAGWLVLAEQTALRSPDGARAVVALWPLVQLADPDRPLDEGRLNAWWDSQGQMPELQRRNRASVLFSLLDALGVELPAAYWMQILPGPVRVMAIVPAMPVWYALGRSSAELHIGETVLLSLVILGNGGPASASEPILTAVISSLAGIGLAAEARAVAIEAALAAGF